MPRGRKKQITEVMEEIKPRQYDECPNCGQKGSVKPRPQGLIGYYCFGCNMNWDATQWDIRNANRDIQ